MKKIEPLVFDGNVHNITAKLHEVINAVNELVDFREKVKDEVRKEVEKKLILCEQTQEPETQNGLALDSEINSIHDACPPLLKKEPECEHEWGQKPGSDYWCMKCHKDFGEKPAKKEYMKKTCNKCGEVFDAIESHVCKKECEHQWRGDTKGATCGRCGLRYEKMR